MNWDVPDLEDSQAGEGEEDLPVQAGQLVVAQVPANMQHACTDHTEAFDTLETVKAMKNKGILIYIKQVIKSLSILS